MQRLRQRFNQKHPNDLNFGDLEEIKDKRDPLRYSEWIQMMLKRGEIQNFDYSEFNDVNEIGSYTVVYSTDYRGTKIAIKKFIRSKDKILANELKQRFKVNNHENIIKFLGIAV
ncbi:12704_t:CDS:2, partial [Gigaspora margarita]